jgi:hypothetical protein
MMFRWLFVSPNYICPDVCTAEERTYHVFFLEYRLTDRPVFMKMRKTRSVYQKLVC